MFITNLITFEKKSIFPFAPTTKIILAELSILPSAVYKYLIKTIFRHRSHTLYSQDSTNSATPTLSNKKYNSIQLNCKIKVFVENVSVTGLCFLLSILGHVGNLCKWQDANRLILIIPIKCSQKTDFFHQNFSSTML